MEEIYTYSTASSAKRKLRCHLIATTAAGEARLRTAHSLLVVWEEDGDEVDSRFIYDITRDRALADTLFSVLSGLWFQPDELAVTVENLLTALDAING